MVNNINKEDSDKGVIGSREALKQALNEEFKGGELKIDTMINVLTGKISDFDPFVHDLS